MNPFQFLLYFIIAAELLLEFVVETLNLKKLSPHLPKEFEALYDEEKYLKSQNYLKENTKFGLLQSLISTILIILFILYSGFNYVDETARHLSPHSSIKAGLIFASLLGFLMWFINLPFNIYNTFVIEEKYGFNKTTFKTFIIDTLKGAILSIVIGLPILALVFWFFEKFQGTGWLWVWIFLTAFQLFMLYIAPVTIMPLFNKFKPLQEGDLKNMINEFAQKQNFKLQGIFVMDGSRRSTKANAYFTGFGKFRRIVLFDTLIEKQTPDELVAILAHEIGHYKLKHIPRQMVLAILSTGFTLFLLSLFINNPAIFSAFQVKEPSVYASLVFFGFLYSPISTIIGLYGLHLSRKYEFEADDYATKTYGKPESLISALKKLSVDSLSNLTPHPVKVFLEYTHPPILQRIFSLRARLRSTVLG